MPRAGLLVAQPLFGERSARVKHSRLSRRLFGRRAAETFNFYFVGRNEGDGNEESQTMDE